MGYTFDDERYDDICAKAVNVWREFLIWWDLQVSPYGIPSASEYEIATELLEDPKHEISFFAIAFANFCLVRRPVFGGPLLSRIGCSRVDPRGAFRGPSWIMQDAVDECTVHLNRCAYYLDRSDHNCRKVGTVFFIHEMGHILWNWFSISDPSGAKGYVKPADHLQEMYAWWFCLEILKLNLGAYAHGQRQSSMFDYALYALLPS